jgi:hypothetical protein
MGPNSILGAGGALCGESLAMSTVLVAQNGARLSGSQPVAVKECAGGESAGGAGSLSRLRVSPARFAGALRGASLATPPKPKRAKHGRRTRVPGTTITYTDSRAGTVTFTVLQPAAGERHGKSCKPRSPKHGRHARKCTLYRTLGSFTHRDAAGAQRLYFTGRLHGHKLKRGSYRLQAVSSYGAGQRSKPVQVAFSITG